MKPSTDQEKFWSSEFGKEYNDRNFFTVEAADEYFIKEFGISRTEMNLEFLKGLDINKILEAGCNVGGQIKHLKQMTNIKDFYGIDIQQDAIEKSHSNVPFARTIQGSIFDIPFRDAYFDMVFTSGVLIHIAPEDHLKAMSEIVRCSKKYIWGFEYFSEKCERLNYRGHEGFMWKTDFARAYLENFKNLKLVKEIRYKYVNCANVDSMYLLEKI